MYMCVCKNTLRPVHVYTCMYMINPAISKFSNRGGGGGGGGAVDT